MDSRPGQVGVPCVHGGCWVGFVTEEGEGEDVGVEVYGLGEGGWEEFYAEAGGHFLASG